MIGPNIRTVRPSQPNAEILNQLSRSVKSLRNMRPVNGAFGTMGLPWGQSITPGNADWTIAFTTSEVPAAVQNDDGTLTLGAGTAYEAYPAIDQDTGAVTISYANSAGNQFPVYNIAKNTDGAVGANHWIIVQRFWSLWIVTWEECSQP